MRSENDSFAILDAALNAARDAGASEADAVFESTDQNISRFANSNLHQNMSEVSAELTLRVIVDANSHGIRRYRTVTSSDATVIAIGANGSGYATALDRASIDVVTLGDEATFKATLCGSTIADIEPGAYDVILEPPATAEVVD